MPGGAGEERSGVRNEWDDGESTLFSLPLYLEPAPTGSTAPAARSLVTGDLSLAEELLVAGHVPFGVVFAQVFHIDVIIRNAAAKAGGLYRPFPDGLQVDVHIGSFSVPRWWRPSKVLPAPSDDFCALPR